MSFGILALIGLAGLAGPALGLGRRPFVPVAVGELLAGVVVGHSGFGWLDARQPTVAFLGDVGFATLMFTAGMHVPLRMPGLQQVARRGAVTAGIGAVLAIGAGVAVGAVAGKHAAIYAVLLAAGSAAIVLPMLEERGLLADRVALTVAAQVAVADIAAVVALPMVLEPSRAGRAAAGGALIAVAALALAFALLRLRGNPVVRAVRRLSKRRFWALDLRLSLIVLFGLAWVAQRVGTSILVAGFGVGLVVAVVGGPKRFSKQVVGVANGFLVPLFFVVLGARLDLRALGTHPGEIGLAAGLFAANVAVRLVTAALVRQPVAAALVATAQLGVPAAVVSIGLASGRLSAGEGAAIVAAALASLVTTGLGASLLARRLPVSGNGGMEPADAGDRKP